MTRERMNDLVNHNNGTGVIVTLHNGDHIHYFYEDFDEAGDGLKRAMNQIYPSIQNGVYKAVEFIRNKEAVQC